MRIDRHSKILLFGGTTEGKRLAEELSGRFVAVTVCVATEYGGSLLKDISDVEVLAGRLDQQSMERLIHQGNYDSIMDATHPYAREASDNIRKACKEAGKNYIRVVREMSAFQEESVVYVEDTEAAVAYLNHTEGNILVTTGSKEIGKYQALSGFQERIYPRVLPLEDSLKACLEAGITPGHIICMQGPFTQKSNEAMLEQTGASYMVTKESGKAGGFEEKLMAAALTGVKLVVIGRPVKEEGRTVDQVLGLFGTTEKQPGSCTLTLVGIGPGTPRNMTLEAQLAIQKAQVCFGAPRMLQVLKKEDACARIPMYLPEDIIPYLQSNSCYQEAVVLLSGDVGFYSGAKKLLLAAAKAGIKTRLVSGVSSAVYFLGKLNISWDQVKFVSLHGRHSDAIFPIRRHFYTFFLMNGMESLRQLCSLLKDSGMGQLRLTVGENLSYESERIVTGTADELMREPFGSLLVVLAENPDYEKRVPFGIMDEEFIRAQVPMTKSEVRAVSLARLQIPSDGVVYDIGAGTGSVSVEAALQADSGRVYAIEKNPEGIRLMEENRKKFGVWNLQIIEGTAPEALTELEPPTQVFIGGSSGQLLSCIRLVLKKNPSCRFVINAITLETLSEVLDCEKTLPIRILEVTQLSVSRAKKAGVYHMMLGQNPVSIITAVGEEETC